ncbi:MAG: DUF637 domain-containing protein [Aeromonas hydrophila]
MSQATISTINNGDILGTVLKELGSSASIKQLATSVATAGALQGLDKAMGVARVLNQRRAMPPASRVLIFG